MIPFDYWSSEASEQLKETLGDIICGVVSTSSHDFLITAGDWNTVMK